MMVMNLVYGVIIGIIATLVMDLWGACRKWLWGVKGMDYAMLGRWLGHMPRGQWLHQGIGQSPAIAGEKLLGWTAHYVTGIVFALAMLLLVDVSWLHRPHWWQPLLTGWLTLGFPLLIIQPALGLGIAASKTPTPWFTRGHNFLTHTAYGIGLYLGAGLLHYCPITLFN